MIGKQLEYIKCQVIGGEKYNRLIAEDSTTYRLGFILMNYPISDFIGNKM